MGFYLLGNPIYVQGKNIEILANMKADRRIIVVILEASTKVLESNF